MTPLFQSFILYTTEVVFDLADGLGHNESCKVLAASALASKMDGRRRGLMWFGVSNHSLENPTKHQSVADFLWINFENGVFIFASSRL